jgi:hypothetical protein
MEIRRNDYDVGDLLQPSRRIRKREGLSEKGAD